MTGKENSTIITAVCACTHTHARMHTHNLGKYELSKGIFFPSRCSIIRTCELKTYSFMVSKRARDILNRYQWGLCPTELAH